MQSATLPAPATRVAGQAFLGLLLALTCAGETTASVLAQWTFEASLSHHGRTACSGIRHGLGDGLPCRRECL